MTAAGNEAETAHPVQEDYGFLFLLNIILFILYTEETFLKDIVFLFCNFEVFSFILVSENMCDYSPHKSALSCFCCIFCALSWTFMSLPFSRGVCSQFVSYLVQLVSLLYCIYSALHKYWNSKDKIALLAVESRHLQI